MELLITIIWRVKYGVTDYNYLTSKIWSYWLQLKKITIVIEREQQRWWWKTKTATSMNDDIVDNDDDDDESW